MDAAWGGGGRARVTVVDVEVVSLVVCSPGLWARFKTWGWLVDDSRVVYRLVSAIGVLGPWLW